MFGQSQVLHHPMPCLWRCQVRMTREEGDAKARMK